MIQQADFIKNDVFVENSADETIHMSIDTESVSHLMMVLSSNLYQNSIGSIVREYVSNAVDANIEVKSSDPVIVKLTSAEFSVQDFGPGLDDKDFRNIISKYGKSTKRDKTDQLGYYGLGTKSAFSYTKTFYFTCRKDNVERKYLLYKGEFGFNIDLLFEKPTNEKNGVTVTIPVTGYDFSKFLTEIKNQLCYFDNVYFDVKTVDLNQGFSIFTEELIQRSTLRADKEMHICLGRVCYPIDWKLIGEQTINLPIGLKFDLSSGIFPTPNRESVIWNESTKKLVKDRIYQVCTDLITRYNNKVKEVDNLYEALPLMNDWTRPLDVLGTRLDISSIGKFGNINDVKLKGIKKKASFYKSKLAFMLDDYRLVAELNYNNTFRSKRLYRSLSNMDCLKTNVVVLNESDKLSGYFADFLKSKKITYFAKNVLFSEIIQKNGVYYDTLFGAGYTRDDLDEYLKVKNDFLKAYLIDGTGWSKSKEFEQFKLDNKVKRKTTYVSKRINKGSGQITISESYKIADRRGFAFKKSATDISNLSKSPFLRVIVEENDTSFCSEYMELFQLQAVRFVKIGKLDYKKIANLKIHNMIKFKDLEKTKSFERIATSLKIERLLESFNKLHDGKLKIVKECMIKVNNCYKELEVYKSKNKTHFVPSSLEKTIIAAAEQGNLWDKTIYDKVLQFEKYIGEFDFINYLRKPDYNEDPKDFTNLIHTLLLMKKLKFNAPAAMELVVKQ